MKHLKITRDEVIKLLEETYKIKDIQFMRSIGTEPDMSVVEDFEYIDVIG